MRVETRASYEQCVREAVGHLVQHLDDPLDLRDLADRAYLSPFHFHRIFRGMVGETPGEFLRRLRLERAAWSLRSTGTPVSQIALDAGFETPEAFTRTFRAAYWRSPTQYRREGNLRIELATTNRIHFDPLGAVPTFAPRDSGGKDMAVKMLDMATMRLGTVRHIGLYNEISEAFGRLCEIAGPVGLLRPGMICLALYHDDPDTTLPTELRSDAAIDLPGDARVPKGITEATLLGGHFATYSHVGPYEHIGDAWARFMGEWLPNCGRRFRSEGTTFEIYANDPRHVPKEHLITNLYIPIEP